MSDYILELKDVVKTFGGVTALGGVHFQLKKGDRKSTRLNSSHL